MFFSEYSLLNLVFLIYFFSVFSFLCSCLTLVDLDIETPSLPFSGSLISNVSVFVFALLHRFVIFLQIELFNEKPSLLSRNYVFSICFSNTLYLLLSCFGNYMCSPEPSGTVVLFPPTTTTTTVLLLIIAPSYALFQSICFFWNLCDLHHVCEAPFFFSFLVFASSMLQMLNFRGGFPTDRMHWVPQEVKSKFADRLFYSISCIIIKKTSLTAHLASTLVAYCVTWWLLTK